MQYNISYAPPMQVKDEPHRLLDTFDSASETLQISSSDYGAVSIVGEILEVHSDEVNAHDPALGPAPDGLLERRTPRPKRPARP
jgi:hypothetical protein